MTEKTHIRVLGLATLAVIMAGFTVPTAFANSDEAAISAPAITTNIFHYGSDELGFFDPYPGWVDPAYELGPTPQEEAEMEAELAALDAAYESLFDRFYPGAIPSEEEQAEFDAKLSALDEEYDAVLARISAALLEGADAEPLFEMLVTINAKYEQLFEESYTEITLSEERQSEFDVRLSALDSVYDGVLEKYGVGSEQSWYIEVGGHWHSPSGFDLGWGDGYWNSPSGFDLGWGDGYWNSPSGFDLGWGDGYWYHPLDLDLEWNGMDADDHDMEESSG